MNPGERRAGFSRECWILRLILLAGFLLRAIPVFTESYWGDEIITANALSMPFGRMVSNRLGNQHSPFYFALLYPWARVFGTSEVALRVPSLLASMAALWIFWLLARRLLGRRRQALLAVLLMALSTASIHYAHEARMYSFVMLATLLSFYFFVRLQDESGAALWLGYGLATLVNLYLTVTTLPFVLVQGLWVLAGRRQLARFAACWSLAGFFYLPMAFFYFRLPRLAVTAFLPPVDLRVVGDFFRGLWLCPFNNPSIKRLSGAATVVTVLFLVFLGAVTRSTLRFRRRQDAPAQEAGPFKGTGANSPRSALLVVLWFVLPLAMHVGYAIVRQPVFGLVRYLLGIVPAYLLILAWGAGLFRNGLPRRAAGLILALIFLFPLPTFFAQSRRPAWRQAIAWIEAKARPGDILTGSKLFELPYRYYRRDSNLRLKSLPAVLARSRPNFRVWAIVIDADSQAHPEIEEWIRSRYWDLQEREFPRLTVYGALSPRRGAKE